MNQVDTSPQLTPRMQQRDRVWFRCAMTWRALQYILGVAAVACPILATLLKSFPLTQIALTASAGICSAVVGFLNPGKLSSGYIKAWRHLDSAIRYFERYPGNEALDRVDAAIDEGELMIEASETASSAEKQAFAEAAKRKRDRNAGEKVKK